MKILRALALGCVLLSALNHASTYHANPYATNIINFPQLVQAVENGFDVRAIVYFNRCLLTSSDHEDDINRFENSSAGFKFTHFFHAKDNLNERSMDSVSTYRKTIIESPTGELLTSLSRLSVFEDNTARLRVIVFDPVLNKKRWSVDWICPLYTVQNGFQNIIQSNFQSTIQSNIQNNVQTNLQNNVVSNFPTNVPSNFQNNAQVATPNVLQNNNSQNPLQTNLQENSGLVLFNYY